MSQNTLGMSVQGMKIVLRTEKSTRSHKSYTQQPRETLETVSQLHHRALCCVTFYQINCPTEHWAVRSGDYSYWVRTGQMCLDVSSCWGDFSNGTFKANISKPYHEKVKIPAKLKGVNIHRPGITLWTLTGEVNNTDYLFLLIYFCDIWQQHQDMSRPKYSL